MSQTADAAAGGDARSKPSCILHALDMRQVKTIGSTNSSNFHPVSIPTDHVNQVTVNTKQNGTDRVPPLDLVELARSNSASHHRPIPRVNERQLTRPNDSL